MTRASDTGFVVLFAVGIVLTVAVVTLVAVIARRGFRSAATGRHRPLPGADVGPVRGVRGFTFDCYGTLIDWETGLLGVLRPWAERSGVRASDEQLLEAFARAETAQQAARPADPYPDILRATHRALAEAFGVAPRDEDAHALARSVGDWPPFADSREALLALRPFGALVIVSNVDRASIARSIARIGVPFDAVVTAEEAGAYKPAINHFHRALTLLAERGVRPEETLHVAQSLYHDHAPAKSIGLATAWIDRRRGKPGFGATPPPPEGVRPDVEAASLAEFAALLRPAARQIAGSDGSA